MLFDDPEAPTTISARFDYGPLTGGDVTGSAVIDSGSIISLDPRDPGLANNARCRSADSTGAGGRCAARAEGFQLPHSEFPAIRQRH